MPDTGLLMFFVAAGAIEFVAAAGAADVAASTTGIYDVAAFRYVCLMGAMLGAVGSVLSFPPKEDASQKTKTRMYAGQALASAIAGLVLTPLVFRYTGWAINVDNCLVASAGVSYLSTITIPILVPFWQKYITSKAKSVTGIVDDGSGK